MAKVGLPTNNEHNSTEIDDLVTKHCSVIEKVKPHRARILFLEIDKTCPKWFVQSSFFCFILTYG